MSSEYDERSFDENLSAMFKNLNFTFCIITLGIGFMFVSHLLTCNTNAYKMSKLLSLDFEVFGTVQGVFFRKHTQKKGQELGLKGWCMNTDKGTVIGQLEGDSNKVEEMKHWLEETGSPQSIIEKAIFQNEKEISSLTFSGFNIRK